MSFDKVKEMMRSRGYTEIKRLGPDTTSAVHPDGYDIVCKRNDKTIGVEDVKEILGKHPKVTRFIFISSSISYPSRYLLHGRIWEVVSPLSIRFNKTKHILVPKYRTLREEEIQDVEKKFKTPRTKFPSLIAKVDAMAIYLGFLPGDVVEVTRFCAVAGESVGYRQVISAAQKI